jgi:hypothetical protein
MKWGNDSLKLINSLLDESGPESFLAPLFWMRGEPEEVILDEIREMNKNGIGSLILEPRPHPDFLGDTWWNDVDIVLHEARRLGMKVWFFDDSRFPSGFGGGLIKKRYPQHLKVYLAQGILMPKDRW